MTPLLRASSAQRIAPCAGSPRASAWMESEGGKDADRGTRIHAWLQAWAEQRPLPELAPDELATAERMREHVVGLVGEPDRESWMCEIPISDPAIGWQGHPDLIVDDGGLQPAFIVDYKTGWGDVPDACDNAQLRVYAAMHGLPCRVAIITPAGVHSQTVYDEAAIKAARVELKAIHAAAMNPNAMRCPSVEACKYCPAFGRPSCPETCNAVSRAAVDSVAVEKAMPFELMAPDQIGRAATAWKILEKRGKQLVEILRQRIEAGETIPGVELGKDSTVPEITDTEKAFSLLPELTQAEFLSACKPSLTKLAAIQHEKMKAGGVIVPQWKARKAIEDALAPVIGTKAKRGSLKIGGAE